MTQNLLTGAANAANTMQGLRLNTNQEQQLMQQQQREEQARQADAQRQQQINELKAQYGETGDQGALRQLMVLDPTIGGELKTQFDALDAESQQKTINEAGALRQGLMTNPEATMQYWQENLSQDPMFAGLADNFEAGDIEGAINEIGTGVFRVAGQETFDKMFGNKTDDPAAPSSVREWEYFNSLSDEQKQQYINMKRANQLYRSGDVTMQVDPIAGGGAVVTEQGEPPTTQADAQTKLTEQEAVKEAEIAAAKQAIDLSQDAFTKLSGARTAVSNLDEAISLVDEGANTGPIISKLPSVQQASIELDNLQGRLGLDVIGNTTFGALSEAELKFALNTALPRNLKGPALKEWLQRKKESQTKLINYLEDAAIYLGTPGNTVADFLAEKKAAADYSDQPRQTDNLTAPMTIDDAQSLDDLMNVLDQE